MADTPTAPTAPEASAPAPNAPSAPAAAAAAATSAPAETAPPNIKVRKHKQRACDVRDAKGKLCAGHLKRWYDYPKEIEALIGPNAEIYRCEFCKTLYRPDPMQMPNSYTLRY
jgi:hypothetical protein